MSDLATGVAWWRDRDWIWKILRGLQQQISIIIINGGGVKTAAFVGSGITYPVKTTDTVVVFDSSLTTQAQPVADLAAGTYIGEEHSFIWYGLGNMNTPPLIQGAGGVLMMPYAGMQSEGIGGLVNSTTITTPGGFITYKWTGAFWAQSG